MNFVERNLRYKDQVIPYKVVFKKQNNIYLKLREDEIVISAPFEVNDWDIEHILYKNIKQILIYWENQKLKDYFKFTKDESYITILGKKVDAKLVDSKIVNPKLMEFKYYEKNSETVNHIYKKLSILYKDVFIDCVNKYAELMDLKPEKVYVRKVKGWWGICHSKDKRIGLNTALIHYDIRVMESVVVHELAHLVYPNHSKDFKAFVLKFFPEYNKWQNLINGKKIIYNNYKD